MPTTERLIENVTENFEKETIERLLAEKRTPLIERWSLFIKPIKLAG